MCAGHKHTVLTITQVHKPACVLAQQMFFWTSQAYIYGAGWTRLMP